MPLSIYLLTCSTGQSRSGTEYGPLVDRPDWSYVDTGAQAPPTKAQGRRARRHLSTLVCLGRGCFFFFFFLSPAQLTLALQRRVLKLTLQMDRPQLPSE